MTGAGVTDEGAEGHGSEGVENQPGDGAGTASGPFAAVAGAYLAAGWNPLPVVGKHGNLPVGFTGREGRDVGAGDVARWLGEGRGGDNVTVRLPRGVVGLDVDEYGDKHGWDTLLDLINRYGSLPPTWSSTARGTSQSRQLLYRTPVHAQVELPGSLGPDLEVIQRHHRHTVCWPSVHPDTGQLYRWYAPDGSESDRPPRVDELAFLPEGWWDARRIGGGAGGAPAKGGSGRAFTDTEIDALIENGIRHGDGPQNEVLTRLVWRLVLSGLSDRQIKLTWDTVVSRTPLTRPGEPWLDSHFEDQLRGARKKLGAGVSRAVRTWATGAVVDGAGDGVDEPVPELTSLTFDEVTAYTCDQGGMAELAVARFGADVCWEVDAQRYVTYQHTAGRWRQDGRGHEELWRRVRALAHEVDEVCEGQILAEGLPETVKTGDKTAREAARARMRVIREWYRVFRNTGTPGVVRAVAPACEQVVAGDFDRDPHLLNTPSGTYDVRTGELKSWRREDRLTHSTVVPLKLELAERPLAEVAPHFAALLRRLCATPDEVPEVIAAGRRRALARWLGYQLHGANPEKKLAVLEGASNIGKNQVMEIVGELLGSELAWLSARPQLLVREKNGRPETEEAKLAGTRLAVVNELTESQVLDEGQVLRLVNPEGARIEVKRLYVDPVTVEVTWKLTITTNELPRARLTDAVVERLLMFRLSMVSVPVEERYDVKRAVLDGEAEGVLAHLVKWWREWWVERGERGSGLVVVEEARARAQAYRDENVHPARLFVEERCVVGGVADYTTGADAWEYCAAYYRQQHPDVPAKFTGGRRKLFEVLSETPGVERVERSRGGRSPLLLGFRGLRVAVSENDLRLLSQRASGNRVGVDASLDEG